MKGMKGHGMKKGKSYGKGKRSVMSAAKEQGASLTSARTIKSSR